MRLVPTCGVENVQSSSMFGMSQEIYGCSDLIISETNNYCNHYFCSKRSFSSIFVCTNQWSIWLRKVLSTQENICIPAAIVDAMFLKMSWNYTCTILRFIWHIYCSSRTRNKLFSVLATCTLTTVYEERGTVTKPFWMSDMLALLGSNKMVLHRWGHALTSTVWLQSARWVSRRAWAETYANLLFWREDT